MTTPALAEHKPRSLDEALADRLKAMAHWVELAKKRLALADRNPVDAPMHIGAAMHFIELASKGVEP